MKIKLSSYFKIEYLFLCLILLAGSFLRFPGVLTNSFAFTYDVGRDMLALWDMLNLHKFSLIGPTSGLPGVFYGPWWYLILLPFYMVVGGDPQGLTFFIALFGIFAVFFAFLFGKKLGGVSIGLSFAAMISVSPALTSLSSQIWSPNIVPIFVIFVLLVLVGIYSEKHINFIKFFLLGFLLALIADLGIVFGVLFMTGTLLSVIIILNKKLSFKSAVSFIFGVLVIFSPRILFDFRHQFLMTKSFVDFLAKGDSSQSRNITEVFINRLGILFSQFNSTFAANNRFFGFFIILVIVFVLIFFFKKADDVTRKFIKTSLIVILTFLIGLIFFRHDVWGHYLVGLPIFYILLFSIAINLVSKEIKYVFPGLFVLVLFLINLNPISQINNLNKPLWVGDASIYRNQVEAVNYVYKESYGKDFKYVVYTPPVHDYTYRYIFKWYGSKKYHYLPSDKSRVAYFILEPDKQFPSRLNDWLKLREKDGKIIKTEKFKSGIIIQTRVN